MDILGRYVQPAVEKCSGLAGHDDLLAGSRAWSPLDPRADPLGCRGLFGSQGANQVQNVLLDMLGQGDKSNDPLVFEDLLAGDDRLNGSGKIPSGPLDDLPFLLAARVVDDGLEQKSVALGFGKWIGSFLLDRILRGQHEEGLGEFIGFSSDGHAMFLHGFKQGRLGFRWCSIDFVG